VIEAIAGVALVKPYYEDDSVTIYHGDCREILPTLEPVDLVLTDPPYVGMKGGYRYQAFSGVGEMVEESIGVGDPWGASFDWCAAAERLVRMGVLVFTPYHSLPETALAFKNLRRAVLLTWHKRNAPPSGANVPRFTEEYIWGLAKKPGLKWDVFKSTMFDLPKLATGAMASPERFVDSAKRAIHPTQKPLVLTKWLLGIGGDTVLDPFMGSGTTLRAAKDLGRKAIGIEIEEKYCEIAVKRMAQGVLL